MFHYKFCHANYGEKTRISMHGHQMKVMSSLSAKILIGLSAQFDEKACELTTSRPKKKAPRLLKLVRKLVPKLVNKYGL